MSEEHQELNLQHNWKVRRSFAVLITKVNGYDVYECALLSGVRVFYIVYRGHPVGYIHCYDTPDGVRVNSTFITQIARRRGLGYAAYKAIIVHLGKLNSDVDRSVGAEALWAKLHRDPDLDVHFVRTGVDDLGYCVATLRKNQPHDHAPLSKARFLG